MHSNLLLSGTPDYVFTALQLANDYFEELFPMQKSGVLQMADAPVGHRIDYTLTPGGTLSQFCFVHGFLYGSDDEQGVFLFPTTVGLLAADVGIGIGNNWAFVRFGDTVTWYQNHAFTYWSFQTDLHNGEF